MYGGSFLEFAKIFLHCKVRMLPFKHLGLLVGANPRRVGSWETLIKLVTKSFSSWKNRLVSLKGILLLLNSTKNFIPILFLSSIKMHVSVWNKLFGMQRHFFRGRGSMCGTQLGGSSEGFCVKLKSWVY